MTNNFLARREANLLVILYNPLPPCCDYVICEQPLIILISLGGGYPHRY